MQIEMNAGRGAQGDQSNVVGFTLLGLNVRSYLGKCNALYFLVSCFAFRHLKLDISQNVSYPIMSVKW